MAGAPRMSGSIKPESRAVTAPPGSQRPVHTRSLANVYLTCSELRGKPRTHTMPLSNLCKGPRSEGTAADS